MAILGGQKKSSSLVTKDFSTAQYSPEESVLAPICAPRVTPDPELLPSLLIYIGLRTYVGRLYYEAYYTTLAILICREGSFRIKLQTKYKHVCVPAASYAWCIVYLVSSPTNHWDDDYDDDDDDGDDDDADDEDDNDDDED